MVPSATLGLQMGDELKEEAACGDGPVDAIYKTVDKITGISCTLVNYAINAITGGKDALGDVTVKIRCEEKEKVYIGRGVSTDILEASAKAYVNAINKLIHDMQ